MRVASPFASAFASSYVMIDDFDQGVIEPGAAPKAGHSVAQQRRTLCKYSHIFKSSEHNRYANLQ